MPSESATIEPSRSKLTIYFLQIFLGALKKSNKGITRNNALAGKKVKNKNGTNEARIIKDGLA